MLDAMTGPARPERRRPLAVERGFTLIEMLITLVIVAVLMAVAVPSMSKFVARKRVEGVAQELATDLRYLRAQHLQRNVQDTRVRFMSTDTMSCYVLYVWGVAGIDCNCTRTSSPVCGDPAAAGASVEIKTVVVPRSTGVTVTSVPSILTLSGFNALPVGNATIRASVASSLGGEVRLTTNASAKPSLCTVSGSESTIPGCAP